jgi:hypothetical protein
VGGESGSDKCEINVSVDLAGINPAVLATVTIGQDHPVVAVTTGSGFRAAVVRTPAGDLGSLANFPGVRTLLDCIDAGVGYQATIVTIAAGSCTVAVARHR